MCFINTNFSEPAVLNTQDLPRSVDMHSCWIFYAVYVSLGPGKGVA